MGHCEKCTCHNCEHEPYDDFYDDDYEMERNEARGLTWNQQYMEDNRYSKTKESDGELDYCDICKEDTEHTYTTGHDGRDSYSYTTCVKCGKREE